SRQAAGRSPGDGRGRRAPRRRGPAPPAPPPALARDPARRAAVRRGHRRARAARPAVRQLVRRRAVPVRPPRRARRACRRVPRAGPGPWPLASTRQTGADQAMEAMLAAIRAGDYAAAHQALLQVADVDPTIRAGIGAFLLALTERFDEAEQVLRAADLPALQVIVRGERQRVTRWRDPAANGSLTATDRKSVV